MKLSVFGRYLFIFILSLLVLCFGPLDLDEVWNYGFMHNMYEGLIPYKDFNMVITPFFPFLFSLPFHILGSSMLAVNVCQALLITFTYYLLRLLFQEKANLIIIFYFFKFELLYNSYNYFMFFLLVVLLFFEKKNVNDYIIGIVIGLAILTKQSVGVCLALVSLFYLFKDYKKVLKRIGGALIPVSIFLIYIVVNNCYKEFFDLCILGLFDFSKTNYTGNYYLVFLFLICISYLINLIIKNKNEIFRYYILAFSSMVVPMFDFHHFDYFLLVLLLLIVDKLNFKILKIDLLMYGCVLGFFLVIYRTNVTLPITYPNDVEHFQYIYIEKELVDEIYVVSSKIEEYKDYNVIFLFEQSYFYKIANDIPINYFDLINTGNWGYNGSTKLLNALKKEENAVFVINRNSYIGNKQTDKTALNYVLTNGVKIDQISSYEFYVIDSNIY